MDEEEIAAILAGIRALIKHQGWTQAALAPALGMSAASLNRQLHGTRPLTLETMVPLARCLALPIQRLFGLVVTEADAAVRFIFLWHGGMLPDRAYDLAMGGRGAPLSAAERDWFRSLDLDRFSDFPDQSWEQMRRALAKAQAPDPDEKPDE